MRTRWIAVLPTAGLITGMLAAAPAAAAQATGAALVPGRTVQTVTLVTGDRVALTESPGGRPQVTVVPATKGAAFQVMTVRNQVYVVPQSAAGNLGAPLDPSLFDVSRLVADGYANTSRPLRLSVSYAAGARHRAVPGFAPASRGTVSVSRAGAARFGRALAAQAGTARRPGGTAQGGPLAGISRISLAGAGPAASAGPAGNSPPGRLYTLTVRGIDRLGQPVTGSFADVMSVDNVNNFLAEQSYYRGVLKYSVPAGNYDIASFIATQEADGSVDYSLVNASQVSVRHDTTVVLDARKATRFQVATPRPSSPVTAQLQLQRNDASGVSFTTDFVTFGATRLYAAPTAPVTEGQFYFYPSVRLGDASGGTDSYVYDMEFPYVGSIPRSLAETVTASQLAVIHARYHSPYPGRAEFEARSATMPWQASMTFAASTLAAPLARTEYVLPVPGLLWFHDVIVDEQDFFGFTQDTVHPYQAGQDLSDDWTSQPSPPGLEQEPSVGEACPVCRSGDTLSLQLMPFTDAAGHYQLPDPTVSSLLSLYQNGTLTGQTPSTFAQFPMSPSPASYRLVLDQSRQAPWWPTTTRTDTTWTWNSQERPPDQLPPGWTCPTKGGGGRTPSATSDRTAPATTGCSFEPLLFVGYQTGAGADDVVPAGSQATVGLSVGQQEGAAATPITGVTAQVSFDDGSTWTSVTPTQTAAGHYQISYRQPALDQTSGFASLHITATDAAGNSIDQTVIRAYPLAVLPAPAAGTAPSGRQAACGGMVAAPYASCMAIVNTAVPGLTQDGQPAGYGPSDIQSAYALPDAGAGQTVALVDAYDDPNAESDLAAYRAQYGLPPCTSANGCFTKVNQAGAAGLLPAPDTGWGLEISLDLDAVSAACPRCHILLVEANSSSTADLGPAVDTAVSLGASAVSNSYGTTGEFSGEQYFEPYYNHPGVPIVVASGDYGYGNGAVLINSIAYPAASRYVVAVGGTSLQPAPGTARGWTESAWDGATSGCSAYIHKPGWQKDGLCRNRTVADVSAVADPKTGLAVYDTFGWGGWLVVGGTSAASPLIASVYALAGNGAQQRYASGLYRDPRQLFDVTAGANGDNCDSTYLCTAGPGYDGPTGLGTPDGTGSF
jgi:Subtilase family